MKVKLAIGFAVLLIGILVYSSYISRNKSSIETTIETENQRIEALQSAYVKSDSNLSEEQQQEYKKIALLALRKMTKAIETVDVDMYLEVYSIRDVLNYVEASTGRKFSSRERRAFDQALQKKSKHNLALRKDDVEGFKDLEVVMVEKINDKQFIAYTNMWVEQIESYSRIRWWFIQQDDGHWAFYDFEDLDEGYRMTTLLNIIYKKGQRVQWVADFMAYFQFSNQIQYDTLAESYPKLKKLATRALRHDLPEDLEVYLLLQRANCSSALEEYEPALADIDKAIAINPILPRAYYTRGYIYMQQEKYEESIVQFKKYAETFGFDSEIYAFLSDSSRMLDKEEIAKEYAIKGIAFNSKDVNCLRSYAILTTPSEWPDLITRMDKVKSPSLCYQGVLEDALALEDSEKVLWILAQFKAKFPEEKETYSNYLTRSNKLIEQLKQQE